MDFRSGLACKSDFAKVTRRVGAKLKSESLSRENATDTYAKERTRSLYLRSVVVRPLPSVCNIAPNSFGLDGHTIIYLIAYSLQ